MQLTIDSCRLLDLVCIKFESIFYLKAFLKMDDTVLKRPTDNSIITPSSTGVRNCFNLNKMCIKESSIS